MTTTDAFEASLRAEFEALVRTKPGGTDFVLHRRDVAGSERLGQYVNAQVEFGWQCYQAATERAAMLCEAYANDDSTSTAHAAAIRAREDGVAG